MTDEKTKHNSPAEEDEIDLIELARNVWDNRSFIIKTVFIFAVLGLIVALLSPNQYTASTKMVPQISSGSSQMGRISSLASMAGVDLNLNQESTELLPQTYPQIIQSLPFQVQIMETPLNFPGINEPVSLFEYYTEYHKTGILSLVKKYTLGLPGTILKAIRGEKTTSPSVPATGAKTPRLSREQEKIRKIISENISLEIRDQEGYIELNSSFHEPEVAAQVAQKTQELLQEYITNFKIEKATDRLEFIEQRYSEKKAEFEKAQEALASFRDRNKNVTSSSALTEEERLQNEYQLAFNVYSNLAQQLEQSKIKVKEDSPVFSVIQPVSVPMEKSKPQRAVILFIWTFLGGVIAVGWVFGNKYLSSIKEKWEKTEN